MPQIEADKIVSVKGHRSTRSFRQTAAVREAGEGAPDLETRDGQRGRMDAESADEALRDWDFSDT